MHLLSLDFGLTFDEILCGPQTAVQFDHLAKEFTTGYTPFQYRWAALSIRKRAQKSKSLAVKHFGDWLDQELPRSLPLSRCASTKYEQPGVYIVLNHNQPLYVGETTNVKLRVEQMLDDQCGWVHLGPRSVKIISTSNHAIQHGLQSILIQRLNPLFNSRLLLPEFKVSPEFATSG